MKQKTKGLLTKKSFESISAKELSSRREDKIEKQIQRGFNIAKSWQNKHKTEDKNNE